MMKKSLLFVESFFAAMFLLSGCSFVWQLDKNVLSVDQKGNTCDLTENSEFNYAVGLISTRKENMRRLRWRYKGEDECDYAAGWSIINTIMNHGTPACHPLHDKEILKKYASELKNAQQLCQKYITGKYGANIEDVNSYMNKLTQEKISLSTEARYRDFVREYEFLEPSKTYQVIEEFVKIRMKEGNLNRVDDMFIRIAALRLETRNAEADNFRNYYRSRFGNRYVNVADVQSVIAAMRVASQTIDIKKFCPLKDQLVKRLRPTGSEDSKNKSQEFLTDICTGVKLLCPWNETAEVREKDIEIIFAEINKLPVTKDYASARETLRKIVRYAVLPHLGELILSKEENFIEKLSLDEQLLEMERWWDAQEATNVYPLEIVGDITDAYGRLAGVVKGAQTCQRNDEKKRQNIEKLKEKINDLNKKIAALKEQSAPRNVALGKITEKQRRTFLALIDKISAEMERIKKKKEEASHALEDCHLLLRWAKMRDLNYEADFAARLLWLEERRLAWLRQEGGIQTDSLVKDEICERMFSTLLNANAVDWSTIDKCMKLILELSKYLSTKSVIIQSSHEQNIIFLAKSMERIGMEKLFHADFDGDTDEIYRFFDGQKSMQSASPEAQKQAQAIYQEMTTQLKQINRQSEDNNGEAQEDSKEENAGEEENKRKENNKRSEKRKILQYMREVKEYIKNERYNCTEVELKTFQPKDKGFNFIMKCRKDGGENLISCYIADKEIRCD